MKTIRNTAVLILTALTGVLSAQMASAVAGPAGSEPDFNWNRNIEQILSKPGMSKTEVPAVNSPAEARLAEEDPVLEMWMTMPFKVKPIEEEMVMETWMTEPFEINPKQVDRAGSKKWNAEITGMEIESGLKDLLTIAWR